MNSSSFKEFESFMQNSLSTDLSMEIGNIMSQSEGGFKPFHYYNNSGNEMKTGPTVKVSPDFQSGGERVYKLESQVASLQDKLDKLIDMASINPTFLGGAEYPVTSSPERSQNRIPPLSHRPPHHEEEASEKIATKLSDVMKDLDGLKRQMVSFSIDDDPNTSSSSTIRKARAVSPTLSQTSSVKSFHVDPNPVVISNDIPLDHSFREIPLSIREYISVEIKKQLDAYRDKQFSSMLADSVMKIEERIMNSVQELLAASKKDSLDESIQHAPLLSSALYKPPQDPMHRKFVKGHQKEEDVLSERILNKAYKQVPEEEKRVRWERSETPLSDDSRESKDAELLLRKLREKIEQKARLVRVMDEKKMAASGTMGKKKPVSLNPPYSKPTFSSHIKKKAFYT